MVKYHYLIDDSIQIENGWYCGAYLHSTADGHPVDFIHSFDFKEIVQFMKKMEGLV